MARRQAAAASHKLIPPSHRLKVGLVQPQETLEHRPSSQNGILSISELFNAIKPGHTGNAADRDSGNLRSQGDGTPACGWIGPTDEMSLLDFFDIKRYVPSAPANEYGTASSLTQAARLGLALPARSVINLWKLADWVPNMSDGEDDRSFETNIEVIARRMLDHVVAESTMSSAMGRQLLEQVIRRRPDGITLADFKSESLSLSITHVSTGHIRYHIQNEFSRADSRPPEICIRSTLTVCKPRELILSLSHSTEHKGAESHSIEHRGADDALPDLVAGWPSVFHDSIYTVGNTPVQTLPDGTMTVARWTSWQPPAWHNAAGCRERVRGVTRGGSILP